MVSVRLFDLSWNHDLSLPDYFEAAVGMRGEVEVKESGHGHGYGKEGQPLSPPRTICLGYVDEGREVLAGLLSTPRSGIRLPQKRTAEDGSVEIATVPSAQTHQLNFFVLLCRQRLLAFASSPGEPTGTTLLNAYAPRYHEWQRDNDLVFHRSVRRTDDAARPLSWRPRVSEATLTDLMATDVQIELMSEVVRLDPNTDENSIATHSMTLKLLNPSVGTITDIGLDLVRKGIARKVKVGTKQGPRGRRKVLDVTDLSDVLTIHDFTEAEWASKLSDVRWIPGGFPRSPERRLIEPVSALLLALERFRPFAELMEVDHD